VVQTHFPALPINKFMLITKTISIDMGHRVPNHKSKCRNLHGHCYLIEVGVDDKIIEVRGESNEGMVMDFSDLKEIMLKEIDARLDHGFMMHQKDCLFKEFKYFQEKEDLKIIFVNFIPTAENIAKYIFVNLKEELKKVGIRIKHVKIWETATSTAIYEKNEKN
jgi:6-pyruvoyltetrahydropterin/6-carboxytetrahydropterin synthase